VLPRDAGPQEGGQGLQELGPALARASAAERANSEVRERPGARGGVCFRAWASCLFEGRVCLNGCLMKRLGESRAACWAASDPAHRGTRAYLPPINVQGASTCAWAGSQASRNSWSAILPRRARTGRKPEPRIHAAERRRGGARTDPAGAASRGLGHEMMTCFRPACGRVKDCTEW
jgi:hypothetical protein